ncbi:MAG: alpha-xylosidase [Oscillospiraceae bacterium]|nr:alpha-xylosidase [Oscillospiraceae bacterium]
MNFLNGMWLTKEGCSIHKAAQAYQVEWDGIQMRCVVPTRPIHGRGDTLNLPVLSVAFSSPRKDIITCTAVHHKGSVQTKADFVKYIQSTDVIYEETEDTCSLQSGDTKVSVSRTGPWRIEYSYKDRVLTASEDGGLAHINYNGCSYLREMLNMDVDETIYGLGERFTAFVKNGQRVICRNEDGGTCTPQAYKNIPFYMSSRGYGLFVDTPATVEFEIGTEVVSKLQFSVKEERVTYHVCGGSDMQQALSGYTALTGRTARLPAWSFGLWLSTSFTTNYDEETAGGMIDGMLQRDIPLDVFHYDCFWMKGFQWCNFAFDSDTFPDPEGMLKRNHARGLKNCVWINPYIAQLSPLFDEAADKGYLLRRPDGSVWQWDLWQAGMGIVDFTNPDACTWYKEKLRTLLDMGVDCFKTDFGERIPEDVVYFNGSDAHRMHNYYTYLYNKTVFTLLEETRGTGEAVLFARSATVGCAQFPLHWGGDSNGTYVSMAESLRGGLSLGMSGFAFWSHDIGGFETEASCDVFKRWIAFGLFSSHSRLHGSNGYRVPWAYDEESCDVLRHFTKLKLSLMPYLYASAIQSCQTGLPMMRSMALSFSEDRACRYIDTQYMLGDSLLVAPVFRADGSASFYLPGDGWTELATGKTWTGGWHEKHCDFYSLPLFVRPGTLLCTNSTPTQSAAYDYMQNLQITLYSLSEGQSVQAAVYSLDGSLRCNIEALRGGTEITVRTDNTPSDIHILCGMQSILMPKGATTLTLLVEPPADGQCAVRGC